MVGIGSIAIIYPNPPGREKDQSADICRKTEKLGTNRPALKTLLKGVLRKNKIGFGRKRRDTSITVSPETGERGETPEEPSVK